MSEYRILIADDQMEVARSLLAGLKSTEFKLDFVADGETALRKLMTDEVFDAVIVDMRMPPDVWGGLWLIQNMRARALNMPVIVLSGEAGQTETIKALRLGANDWVAKEDASRDIESRLREQLQNANAKVLSHFSHYLPTPISEKVKHYRDVMAEDGTGLEKGLATITAIESAWRLVALVNLSALPQTQRLQGVVEQQLLRPTMGIYLDLLKAVGKLNRDNIDMRRLSSCIPLSEAHKVVVERNRGIGHPIGAPSLDAAIMEIAERQLLTFLRRYTDNSVGFLGTVQTMTYEQGAFRVDVQVHGSTPTPRVVVESLHALNSGEAFWISNSGVTRLWPWIVEDECTSEANRAIFLFDGAKVKGKELENRDAPLIYTGCSTRQPLPTGGSLRNLLEIFSRS